LVSKIIKNKSIASWIIYDVANTVFHAGVVGLFMPLWITGEKGGNDGDLGFPVALAMLIVFLVSPFWGAILDHVASRRPLLFGLNITVAIATFMIGMFDSLNVGILFFCIAFIALNLAELIYNSLLVEVSTPETRGKIGGIGIGFGYLGAIVVVGFGLYLEYAGLTYAFGFKIAGIIVLVMALPITLFLSESRPDPSTPKRVSILRETRLQMRQTLAYFREFPYIRQFFIARYFYMVTAMSLSTFAVLYGTETVGFTPTEIQLVLLAGILVAIPGAVMWGYIVDRVGPKTTLGWVLLGWLMSLIGAVSIPWLGLTKDLWWLISVVIGICYGGIWAADRPLLITLSPTHLGEMFGIYSATSRASFFTGSFLWPFIAVTLGLGQPMAVLVLMLFTVFGVILLMRLPQRV
jgi:UMF1 family MFS transporter